MAAGVPERLGPYRLIEEVGRGGMARVYRARRDGDAADVAVKVLALGGETTEDDLKRFQREAAGLARVEHPGVVRIYGAGTDGRWLWFAMELIEGRSLDEIALDALGWRRCVEIVRDAARALHAAHEAGVVHRDVKPGNILLGADGRVVVTDFGMAKQADSSMLTLPGTVLGTPSFMSPEQALGRSHAVDRRTDVYGLGATLYWLLTGRPPFTGDSTLAIARQIVHADVPPFPPGAPPVPSGLETVVRKALEKRPADRYATAAEFADDLDAVLEARTPRARPPGPLGRMRRWMQRRAVVAGVLGVLVVALGIGMAAFLVSVASMRRVADAERRARIAAQHLATGRELLERFARHRYSPEADLALLWPEVERAIAEFDRAIEADPAMAEAYYERAEARYLLGDTQAALADLDAALRLRADFPAARWRRASFAVSEAILSAVGLRESQARNWLARAREDLARLGPLTERESAMAAALEAALEGRTAEALAAARAGWERTRDEEFLRLEGDIHSLGRNFAEAAIAYGEALKVRPSDPLLYHLRAIARNHKGDAAGALSDSQRAIELNPNYGAAWVNRGAILYAVGRHAEALDALDRALALGFDGPVVRHDRGVVLEGLGRMKDAHEEFLRAMEKDPSWWRPYWGAGRTASDRDEAFRWLDEAMRRNPDAAGPYVTRSLLWLREQEWERVRADATAALERDPANVAARVNRAAACIRMEELAAAERDLEEAKMLDPANAAVWYHLGLIRELQGRYREADREWNEAIRLDAAYAERVRALREARRAAGVEF